MIGAILATSPSPIRNQRGFVVTDFIFSIIIAVGLGVVVFSISYSLVVVEVTQYVSFATSRAHAAANKDPDEQKAKARRKFDHLINNNKAIGSIFKNGWFEIGTSAKVDIRSGKTGDGRTFEGLGDSPNRNWFIGVSVPLNIKVLALNLPLLGETAPDHPDGFPTKLNSFLIREPSSKECKDFMEQRRNAIKNLPSAQTYFDQNAYVAMEDNGC